jgi:glycine cleavage system aminomethyltransferase T/glycine/D-amino acid oxidase-like deaminating enzyme
MATQVPTHARVVIIGGGIVGCSLAYHLTQLGWRDTVLLERRTLSCGTSWHAAGLVSQLRATHRLTALARYAHQLYQRLEAETGRPTGFRMTGGLTIARTRERMEELKRGVSVARAVGVEAEIISPQAAGKLWPLMRTDDLVGAVYFPQDGVTHPGNTTLALGEGARQGGAVICEGVKVTGIARRNGEVSGVTTDHGEIACEVVVNCGGMWAREIGRMAGANVPLCAAEHMYALLRLADPPGPDLRALRDPDGFIYCRERDGHLLMGGFAPASKAWGQDGIPDDFAFGRLRPDWEQVRLFMDSARVRVPALERCDPSEIFNGPESFTPDTRFILGEAPELRRFFVAAGFNSTGIASAPGATQALAHWIVEGRPTVDLWDVDIRRFSPFQGNGRYLRDRTVESLGLLYAMHWPFRQGETARPVRRSVFHESLAARGACFGVVSGWERPNWYAPPGVEPRYAYSFGRQNWFPYAAEEHRAVREGVGLFDQSSFAKFLLQGRDAEPVLRRICANEVGGPSGKVVYTSMLNERGGIECDLTVTRIAEDRYFIVTAAATATHDYHWIGAHIPDGARAALTDVTSAFAVLGVMGPASRRLLSRCTDADLSNAAFPFASFREITIGYAPVWALRITYVGELGWELYIPTEYAAGVYDVLIETGGAFALRHAGYHAMDSLRCEKGYRAWGSDLTSEDTPLEAGLGFAVKFERDAAFIGREALLSQRERPLKRRMVILTLNDPQPLLFGEEPIYRDDVLIGRVTSAAYGHTLGRSVGLGYLEHEDGITPSFLASGTYVIDVACERVGATLHLRAPHDPAGTRVRD